MKFIVGTSGIRMIAIGTNQGVWTGIEGDTNTIHLAIAISDVQQIAVLEDEYILLILAGKKKKKQDKIRYGRLWMV